MSREEYERHPLIDVYSFGVLMSYIFYGNIYVTPTQEFIKNNNAYKEFHSHIVFLIQKCMSLDPD